MVGAWDPVGLIAAGAPPDECDCIVGGVLRVLERGESAEQLGHLLISHVAAHFGVPPRDPSPFAAEAVAWYRSQWPGSYV